MIEGIQSTGSSSPGSLFAPNDAMGRDDFLTLLVAQLRNQDPLSPMDGKEMAVQLAQFSSVEQLINLNENMEAQAASNAAMGETLAATLGSSLLGREVLAAGDLVSVPAQNTVTVDMPVGGGAVTVKLFDANGTEVGSQPLGSVGGGRQELDVSTLTNGLPDGHYRYEVEAVNADGDSLAVQTYTKAVIEGMRFTPQGLRLIAGGIEIPFSAVAELGLGT